MQAFSEKRKVKGQLQEPETACHSPQVGVFFAQVYSLGLSKNKDRFGEQDLEESLLQDALCV